MQLFKGLKLTKEERKSRIRFHKGLKEKRKKYVKFFKEGGPGDVFYLYKPIKNILQDMYEFYKNGDCIVGVPVIADENGEMIEKDDRAETLKTALDLIQKHEDLDDAANTIEDGEKAHKVLIEAFAYIADHMEKWWD